MATYVVTTSNWNSVAFWSSISVVAGDTVDFSALPSSYELIYEDNIDDQFILSDGVTTFTVGESGDTSADAVLASGVLSDFFTVIATQGNDTIDATDNDESLVGGGGDDTLVGRGGNDTLIGGDGADRLRAEEGDDSLVGNDGDDALQAGTGNDTLDGGADNDEFDVDHDDGASTVIGGTGTDTLDVDGDSSSTGFDIIFTSDGAGTATGQGSFTGSSIFSGIEAIQGSGGTDSVDASATSSGVYLRTDDGDDTLAGGTGDDTLEGLDDADTFLLGNGFGNDVITGGEGGDDRDVIDLSALTTGVTIVYSADEAGTITDGSDTASFTGIEEFILTDQSDDFDGVTDEAATIIDAGGGSDTIRADGADTVLGGSGDDSVQVHLSSGTASIDGGTGQDTLDWDGETVSSVDVTLTGDTDGTYSWGSGGGGSFENFEDFFLTTQGDTFDGSVSTSALDVDGEEGADSLTGGSGDDTLDGGADADTLIGGLGNDRLLAGTGDDSLVGGEGSDSLFAGTDNNTLDGGAGDDFFETDHDDGNVTIIGGTGTDTLDVDSDGISATTEGLDVIFTSDGAGTIDSQEVGDPLDGEFSGIEAVTGSGGTDSLDASINSSAVSLFGQSQDDTLLGGAGDDSLDGGTDNDSLDGGLGADSLTGGLGNDIFVYVPGDGADTITDFNTGNTGALGDGDTTNNDFIDLSGFYDGLTELRADFEDDGLLNQSNDGVDGVDYSDNSQFGALESLTFSGATRTSFTNDNTGVVCFAKGTRIATPDGDVPIETLNIGDLVQTADNGPQPLLWLGRRHIGKRKLAANPKLLPVMLKPELSGASAALIVSQQHGVVLRHDGEEVLIRAKFLAAMKGGQARIVRGCRSVTYYHLLFASHQIVFANGAPSESFYPGTQALDILGRQARTDVLRMLPAHFASCEPQKTYGETARVFERRRSLPEACNELQPSAALLM